MDPAALAASLVSEVGFPNDLLWYAALSHAEPRSE
jgi:hypothetical protein